MEVFVTLGRDYVVAYQNRASASIEAMPVGVSIIKRTFLFSNEEVRDTIFGGKSLSCSNRLLFRNGRSLLLTRDYRPMLGRDGEVVGVISTGSSRLAPSSQDYADLSAIVSAKNLRNFPTDYPLQGRLPGHPLGNSQILNTSSTTSAISAAAGSLISRRQKGFLDRHMDKARRALGGRFLSRRRDLRLLAFRLKPFHRNAKNPRQFKYIFSGRLGYPPFPA